MKGSLVVVAFFCAGCMIGAVNNFQYDMHSVSMYVLYALMLQVGISIGSNKKLKELIKSLRLKMLLVPMATIAGTLLFSALASLLLSQWSVFDCMAVGSGFAYYSLSSILITQFKETSIGLQLATELGTIALPVSYTHLDVYKRQRLSYFVFRQFGYEISFVTVVRAAHRYVRFTTAINNIK